MQTIKVIILIFTTLNLVIWGGGCSTQEEVFANSNQPVKIESSPQDSQIIKVEKLIEANPNSAKNYTELASIYLKKARETGDFSLNSKAEIAVAKALQIDTADLTARKLKASLHLTFQRFAEALEAGKKLQTEFPDDEFVYGILSDANVELGNYPEAVEAAQKMMSLKPNLASYARVAHLRSLHGDHNGAVEMFKLATRNADTDKESQSWCLVQLGNEFWKYGKYTEAEKNFDEALQNFPNYHLALAEKGRIRASINDFENALKFLNDANNRVPNVDTTILLGDIYSRLGNSEKAQQQYELVEIIEQRIGVNSNQKRLALFRADHDVQLDAALAIAKRESERRKDIWTIDTLAWCLYKKGQLTDAKNTIAKALSLKTNDARILYHAGMIEKDLGNAKEAKQLLQQALKLNPMFDLIQSEKAQKALSELK